MVTADGKLSPWFTIHASATKTLNGLALRLRLGPQSTVEERARAGFRVRPTADAKGLAMTDADKQAFARAIEMARAHDEGRRQQIDDFLRTRAFEDVGRFAAYGCQMRALRLPPWAYPPCWINEAEIDAIIARGDDPHGRFVGRSC